MGSIVRSFTTAIAVVITVAIFACIVVVVVGRPAVAQASQHWSWTALPPVLFSSTSVGDIANINYCARSYQSRAVDGVQSPRNVCTFSGDSLRFGTYYADGGFVPVIGVGLDAEMYPIGAPCDRYDTCLYVPEADILVTKQHLINGVVRSMVIYKNFSERIKKVISLNSSSLTYDFDMTNPDYIYKTDTGYPAPITAVAASDNGKWLAVELRGRGIGLMNLETFEMRRIHTVQMLFGYGYDPSVEMAVSNDGRHVAVMGYNTGLALYDVDPGCGEILTNDNMMSGGDPAINCPKVAMFNEPFIDRFFAALHPTFNQDGSELRFYAASYDSRFREVVMRAAGFESRRVDYLALGDSYSSGEGETSDSHYLPGTNVRFEKCHVSDRSYPFLIAQAMGIEAQYMKSVACSGAVIGDIIGPESSYMGQNERFGEAKLRLQSDVMLLFKQSARESFMPGRIHQAGFIQESSPRVISIGIGGNDAGFSDKLITCLGLDTCEWAGTAKGREKTAQELKSLFPRLVDTYTSIHEASPNSRIYVVGYPNLMADGQCDLLHEVLLNQSEREFFRQAVVYLNTVIEAAAQKAGVKYIDITGSFGESALCGSAWPKAMNGLKAGDDFPNIAAVDWLKIIGQESFHPRPAGHQMTAALIMSQVTDLRTYDYCRDRFDRSDVVCPVAGIVAPDPSDYWLVDGRMHGYESLRRMSFMDSETYSYEQVDAKIALTDYSFAAGSDVEVEIHSEPYDMGIYRASDTGSLSVEMALPGDLEPGFHTVHILGMSYSGEPIDVYQVIKKELRVDEAFVAVGDVAPVVANAQGPLDTINASNDDKNRGLYEKSQLDRAADPFADKISKLAWVINTGADAGGVFVAIGWFALLLGGAYAVYARVRRR